ncbi:MAG: nitroreductase family protein [Desulfovibrio sp.]|nr:nitroreductase family protein [Desulfovibrio sp.]
MDKPENSAALDVIMSRRSVRAFTSEEVSDEQVEKLLRAAMAAPSAGNAQPWEFVVIRDKALLDKVPAINPYAAFAPKASVGILVCTDPEYEKFPGYWIEDTSAATENLLLAAHALGLGAVWTGVYPDSQRVSAFRALVQTPERIIPMAFILVGYPQSLPKPADRFLSERIHQNTWSS